MPVAIPSESPPYRVFMHGEAPGENEDRQGIPFVGETGSYLRELIPQEWKHKLYWSNTIRCSPPKNRKPTPEEIQCCSIYQERDLDIIKPQAILAIGDYALKWYWNTAWISQMRGIPFPVELKNGFTTWCTGIFHPSYVLRSNREDYNTGEVTNPVLPVFRTDLNNFFNRIPDFAERPPKVFRPPDNILYPRSEQEVYNLFDQLKDPYALDIETFKKKPYQRDARIITSAMSDGELTFAFPVSWPGLVDNWGLRAFNTVLRKKKTWIAQHSPFELVWIWSSTKTPFHDFHDTEALARLHHKRAGLGSLDDLSRIYLGIDVKKLDQLDKTRLLDYPMERVLRYNGLDAWSTAHVFYALMERVTENDLENYVRILEAIQSTVGMEIQGLHVNLDESEKLQKKFYQEYRNYEMEAEKIPEVREYERKENKIFSLSAPEQVGHILVKYCGLNLPKTEAQKQYSTDESDLTPLAGKHPLVDLTLSFREVQKLLSTYIAPILSGALIGTDGLLHPSYTVCHTRTYRLSCEDPNIQNWPKRAHKEIRKQIIAPKGHILAAFDYAQLEARGICMFSKDPTLTWIMIEQAKAIAANDHVRVKELDIHWKWLYRILELHPPYLDHLAKLSGEKEEDKILNAGRTIIKTDFVFATFYGSQPNSLSTRCEVPLKIMQRVWDEFWDDYKIAKKWVDSCFAEYYNTGEVYSITGRVRNEVLPGNEIVNSPVQGTAAEIVIEAQNALAQKALQEDMYLYPRINIHDDMVFILPDNNDLDKYIITIGQEIVKPRFLWITVPLATEARVGYDWASLEAVTNFVGGIV
jgi:uracil-DNA glycosylase family 4